MGKRRPGHLSRSMTIREFDHGYWYATELKEFAQAIGIPRANSFRKDELEAAIKRFLQTHEIESRPARDLPKAGVKDVALGLRSALRVSVYTNDKETKEFLEREARKVLPSLKKRSGARYRLNRWREEQLRSGRKLTYGDLVDEYVRLCQSKEPFARIPHGRYINFMADFLAAEQGPTREQAIKAWEELKTMDIPKDYRSWAAAKKSRRS